MSPHFDEDDTTLGFEVVEEACAVLAACQAHDAAWHHAVPTVEFQRGARARSTG
ncbi:DUF6879 family protein [Streptomyces sp. NPDC003006]